MCGSIHGRYYNRFFSPDVKKDLSLSDRADVTGEPVMSVAFTLGITMKHGTAHTLCDGCAKAVHTSD